MQSVIKLKDVKKGHETVIPSWRDMGSVTSQSTLTDRKDPGSNQQPSGRRTVALPCKLRCHGPWPVLASRLVTQSTGLSETGLSVVCV